MIEFRTEIEIQDSPFKISHNDRLVSIGSCFAENVGRRLNKYKFQVLENPFGILYNPHSILQFIKVSIQKKNYAVDDLVISDGIYCHFDAHSRISGTNSSHVCKQLNEAIISSFQALKNASWIFISLGTSFYYEKKGSGQIVANCHKIPASEFIRKSLSVDENFLLLEECILTLRNLNKGIKCIFTVSPIRHIRDGLQENQVSKSALLLAVNRICKNHDQVYYFPSYEILLDDLRDYRFYASDMIHPNDIAINYIWEKFGETYIDSDSQRIIKALENILSALNHKAFHPDSDKHQKFLKSLFQKMEEFEREFPKIKLTPEKKNVLNQIN